MEKLLKHNIATIPRKCVDWSMKRYGVTSFHLGKASGAEKLYATLDVIEPGATSCKLHSHSAQEEFFYVVKGECILRTQEDEEIHLAVGDWFCKPAGKGIAHQFINSGNEPCEILDVGTREPLDVVEYPEEQVVYVKSVGRAFRMKDALKSWDSTPVTEK